MGHLEGNSIVWWDACGASFYDESMLCGRYLVRVYVMWWYLDHTKIRKRLPWEHYENAWLGDTIVWQESLWICLWGQHGGGFQGRFYLLYITAIMLVVINKIFQYYLCCWKAQMKTKWNINKITKSPNIFTLLKNTIMMYTFSLVHLI